MSPKISILAVVLGAMLSACGSKTDVNEKNFSAAISQYLEKKGDLCLKNKDWPMDITPEGAIIATNRVQQMTTLEALGFVKGVEMVDETFGYKRKLTRYSLTAAAKPFVHESHVPIVTLKGNATATQQELCYGKRSLKKIVKWQGPLKLGDYQEATIVFIYNVNNVADWAKRPEVQDAFPEVKYMLDGAGSREDHEGVLLTSQGWEASGMNR